METHVEQIEQPTVQYRAFWMGYRRVMAALRVFRVEREVLEHPPGCGSAIFFPGAVAEDGQTGLITTRPLGRVVALTFDVGFGVCCPKDSFTKEEGRYYADRALNQRCWGGEPAPEPASLLVSKGVVVTFTGSLDCNGDTREWAAAGSIPTPTGNVLYAAKDTGGLTDALVAICRALRKCQRKAVPWSPVRALEKRVDALRQRLVDVIDDLGLVQDRIRILGAQAELTSKEPAS